MTKNLVLFAVIVAASLVSARAEETDAQAADKEAIRDAVKSYVDAFNRHEAKSLAAMWTPEAVYTNPQTGEEVVGRAAIETQFSRLFARAKGLKLEAKTHEIRFLSPGVAIEQGTAKLATPGQDPQISEYTAIFLKRGGNWLLDRVTEEDLPESPSHYKQLKELEWLVGRWTDEDESATVTFECHWAKNNNFLIRSFTVQIRDRIDMAGMQVIGWDAAAKKIRSWTFDSDGGFGQGTWKKKDNRWHIEQSGVLADGRKTASVNILTKIDDKTSTLQSVNRTVDGELLPNIDEVKVTKE